MSKQLCDSCGKRMRPVQWLGKKGERGREWLKVCKNPLCVTNEVSDSEQEE